MIVFNFSDRTETAFIEVTQGNVLTGNDNWVPRKKKDFCPDQNYAVKTRKRLKIEFILELKNSF